MPFIESDSLLRQDDRHLCWGVRVGPMARTWFNSNTNMLRGMFCFGVKCECVYSPLEEDMLCAVCSIWSSQPQTRGRGGVQASAPPTFIWYVRPCGLCCVCAGWWLDMCVLECSRKKTFFVEHFFFSSLSSLSFYKHIVPLIMVQWFSHCTAYHKVYRFGLLKVMEPMFMFPTSTIQDQFGG